MNKKLILGSAIFLLSILSISFVSAGLCKGYDGYYHDCDDDKYFDDYGDWDDEYYSYGKYYKSRPYYYRDYYQPKSRYRSSKIENYYKDTEEYTRTTESRYKDRYGYENIKTIISEKTEIESDYEYPYRSRNYKDDRYYRDDRDNKDNRNNYYKPVPWHYSQYKKYY